MENKKFTVERVRALADKIHVYVTGGRHGRAQETKVILPELALFDRMEICQALYEYADTLDCFKTAKDWIRSGKVAKAAEHGDKQAQKASEQCSKVYNGYDVRLSKVTKEVLCNLTKQDD